VPHDSDAGVLPLAEEILKLLKDANEQYKKENPKPKKQKKQKGQGQEQDGEAQSGGQGDLDEEEEPQDGSESGGSGKPDKSDDESEDKDDAKDGSGDGDGESDEKKDDADKDGSGKGDDEEGDESDSKPEGKKEDGPDGDTPYEPDDSSRGEEDADGDEDGTPEDDEDDNEDDPNKYTDLDDETGTLSKQDAINEAIKEHFDNMDPEDAQYLSKRELDEHKIPKTYDADKQKFRKEREQVAVMVASMTRALEQALRSLSRCRRQGYKRQGRIDKKRLVQISKGLSKEIFFKIKDGQNLDVAVEIILDESGSMGNYHEVRLLAIAIGEALNSIGVPFEITGTTTKYGMGDYSCPDLDGMTRTNPIMYNHYVMFGETWDAVRHRLVHTGAHIHNVDGEAIEYCVFRLAQRPERRKIVFSLSDGSPCGGQGRDSALGQNIKRVSEKARKAGTEVYGFGIGTSQPEVFYGKENFVYMDNPTTMDQVFIRKLADVITGGQVRV
jgi:cobalamin biosynthesis protein CobT